jgi:hypothetical protein
VFQNHSRKRTLEEKRIGRFRLVQFDSSSLFPRSNAYQVAFVLRNSGDKMKEEALSLRRLSPTRTALDFPDFVSSPSNILWIQNIFKPEEQNYAGGSKGMIKQSIMVFNSLEDLVLSSNGELHSIYKMRFADGRFGYYYYTAERPVFVLRIVFSEKDLSGWIGFDQERNRIVSIQKFMTGAIWISEIDYDSLLNEFLETVREKAKQ